MSRSVRNTRGTWQIKVHDIAGDAVVVFNGSRFVLRETPASWAVYFPNNSIVVGANGSHYYVNVLYPQEGDTYTLSKVLLPVKKAVREYTAKNRVGGTKLFYKKSEELFLDNYHTHRECMIFTYVQFTK